MKLDNKLREILKNGVNTYDTETGKILFSYGELVAQIKQAFQEQYWLMPKHSNTYPDPLVMSGQEFYDRFGNELKDKEFYSDDARASKSGGMVFDQYEALEAAHKAAGLDNE